MERVGEKLRRRREELGFTIEDIARATKYRPEIIKAVEEGRAGVFPAEAYRQAFLRAYAEKLDLDPAEVVREQKSEEERVQEALKGIRLKPRTGRGLRRTLIWPVVIVAVAAALLLLYDRVIKVRMLSEPAGEVEGPDAGGAESAPLGIPDSQSVAQPSDSTGASGVEEAGEGKEAGPGDIEEDTGPSEDEAEDAGLGPVPNDREEPQETDSYLEEPQEPGSHDLGAGDTGSARSGFEAPASEEMEASLGRNDEKAPGGEAAGTLDSGGQDAQDALKVYGLEEEEPGRPQAVSQDRPAGPDWLAVRVRGYSVRATLRAGDSILVDCRLEPGFSDTFYSFEPFWADTIVGGGNAILFVLNGEEVPLPDASGSVITDFRISP